MAQPELDKAEHPREVASPVGYKRSRVNIYEVPPGCD